MVKTKFSFFQMQIEGMFRNAIELCQTPCCKTPERFDAVDMPFTTGEFVVAMMNPEVLKLPTFSFSNSRTKIISVFNIHLSELTHFSK